MGGLYTLVAVLIASRYRKDGQGVTGITSFTSQAIESSQEKLHHLAHGHGLPISVSWALEESESSYSQAPSRDSVFCHPFSPARLSSWGKAK